MPPAWFEHATSDYKTDILPLKLRRLPITGVEPVPKKDQILSLTCLPIPPDSIKKKHILYLNKYLLKKWLNFFSYNPHYKNQIYVIKNKIFYTILSIFFIYFYKNTKLFLNIIFSLFSFFLLTKISFHQKILISII